ncbi:16S rRNA (uracil(1498)-N(3))-methyltransferase [Borrelia turcica IST7]|uniref:Ribosomal RNA small subunit methyltransferase E n=1 Tax=Borrelia turcica IST7 TaxID=1104446 RepID=A0A386PMC9_9SPIR|nr:16S rRNA (uracil(1498)-N(3))-methyltransferase [Borrelia turcica]AYE36235.1 16S rRNA (uracil(1498)-N(3))-methyltransferase [Borrelia turcica IST7]
MKQIVLNDDCLFGNDIIINDIKIYHYLIDVRRFKVGDALNVLVKGKEIRFAKILSIDNKIIRLSTLKIEKIKKRDFEISMFISNLKGRKLDLCLRQIVEIGVDHINIVNGDNSVSKIDMNDLSFKRSRFAKIIDEALKQSGNIHVPDINFYKNFFSIPYSSSVHYYVAHQEGGLLSCGDSISPLNKIGILIGPEGCFSMAEINLFKDLGFKFVKFNTSILRAETAIVYSLICFKLLLEGNNG